jgi:hypothetical protein
MGFSATIGNEKARKWNSQSHLLLPLFHLKHELISAKSAKRNKAQKRGTTTGYQSSPSIKLE